MPEPSGIKLWFVHSPVRSHALEAHGQALVGKYAATEISRHSWHLAAGDAWSRRALARQVTATVRYLPAFYSARFLDFLGAAEGRLDVARTGPSGTGADPGRASSWEVNDGGAAVLSRSVLGSAEW